MFIAFGVIAILVGAFAFYQGSRLSMLAALVSSASGLTGGWMLAAGLIIMGGALCCACGNGKKRSMAKGAMFCFIAAAVIALLIGVGDLKIYGWVSAFTALIVAVWLLQNKGDKKEEQQEKPEEQTDNVEQTAETEEEPVEIRPPRNN